jgi:hypothetical protein
VPIAILTARVSARLADLDIPFAKTGIVPQPFQPLPTLLALAPDLDLIGFNALVVVHWPTLSL